MSSTASHSRLDQEDAFLGTSRRSLPDRKLPPNDVPGISRRAFLGGAAAAVAATALSQPGDGSEPSPSAAQKVLVGAHPWVYAAKLPNHDITPELDQIFADMKYAGMDAIELMHTALHPADAVARIGELSAKHSLPILGTSFGGAMWDRDQHGQLLDEAHLVITRLAELGGRTLGTSVGHTPDKKTASQLDAQADLLRRIMAIAKAHKVVVNLHNHTYEVKDDLYDLKGTLARIPDVRLGPDLDWLVQANVDPVEFIQQFGKQIVFLHLRDQRSDKTWVEAMGEGDMDYQAVGQALHQINFGGDAVIELAHPADLVLTRPLRESLKISRQFVRDTLGY
jgi:sugar phosphate isomerase/epimerase